MTGHRLVALAALLGVSAGCRGVPVNVATPKPLAVDVTLRVDIYQHEGTQGASGAGAASGTGSDAEARRRDRMAQIQDLKNSRLVGEDRTGRLRIIERPPGAYGSRVEELVAAENADRTALMRAEAATRRVPLATIEAERAAQWRANAFPGEWIEEQQADGSWRWVQKSADAGAPRLTTDPGGAG